MADKFHPERDFECKGHLRPTKKGKSFCYRIVKGEYSGQFRVQFHSKRTGKLIGYLDPQEQFTADKEKAQTQFYGYKVNAEFQMQRLFRDAQERGRGPSVKQAKDLLKKIDQEAKKKPKEEKPKEEKS